MSDELKSACDRLRRCKAGNEPWKEIYGLPQTSDSYVESELHWRQMFAMKQRDHEDLADAYLTTNPADGSPDATKAECDRLRAENLRLRKINSHVPPRIMVAAKEAAGFGTSIITDWTVCDPEIVDPTEAKFARLVNNIKCLRKYVLVEGRPSFADDCDKMIGFAYEAQQWGFAANPEYEAYEALEKCEKWLHTSLDEFLKVVGIPTESEAC